MNTDGYEYFGAHMTDDGGYVFRVWAPGADRVRLVGDFCDWSEGIAMRRVDCDGVWEHTLERGRASESDKYKYKIFGAGGWKYKADPYAVCCEAYPADASVIFDLDGYEWRDKGWIAFRERAAQNKQPLPLNIYSLSTDTWLCGADKKISYATLATELAPYVKQMGYTHVLIDPAQEKDDTSKVTAVCAPNAQMGTPKELMAFVDSMHEAGIGVLFNISLDCFSDREASLLNFDGQALYDIDTDGTKRADMRKTRVRSLFESAVRLRVEKYHADGICVDGILPLLLCEDRDKECVGAFFSELNSRLKSNNSGVFTLAKLQYKREKKLLDQLVSQGFDFVWFKGSKTSAVLPDDDISSDPCVLYAVEYDGRKLSDMSLLRSVIGYDLTRGNATLTVMGAEFGCPCGDGCSDGLEWNLLGQTQYATLQRQVAQLNVLRLKEPALFCGSAEKADCKCADAICYRKSFGEDELLVFISTSPMANTKLPEELFKGKYNEVFNSEPPYSIIIFKREKL